MLWNQTTLIDCEFRAMVPVSDDGYVLAGQKNDEILLFKTDLDGNMVWNKTYGAGAANSLTKTWDGGYALVGGGQLIKTDVYGNVELNQTCEEHLAGSLVATYDRGYAFLANTSLVKTDAQGNVVWTEEIESGYFWSLLQMSSLIETSDGGYIVTGNVYSFFTGKTVVLVKKTFENGVVPDLQLPSVCVDYSQNITYTTDTVSLNFTVNEETSWIGYSLDGQDNVTVTTTTINLTELADGSHNMTVYATDTDDNTAASETISFTVAKEIAPPITKDDETTDWTTTVIVTVAVAIAILLVVLYFTRKRKTTAKDGSILVS
jgi:hypothetical protein